MVENKALQILQILDDNWGAWRHLMWYAWVPVVMIISKKD